MRKLPSVVPLVLLAGCGLALARPAALPRKPARLDLPCAPAALIPTDLDQDGSIDLAVLLDYRHWTTQSTVEQQGFAQSVEVVPLLEDVRELQLYLSSEGGIAGKGLSLRLSADVTSLAAGPPFAPLLALTDAGVSAIRLATAGTAERLRLEPLVAEPTVMAGSGALLPTLPFARDLDMDGTLDLAIPTETGLAHYRGSDSAFSAGTVQRVVLPTDDSESGQLARRFYPLPRIEDVNGDATPDLIVSPGASNASPFGGSISVRLSETVAFLPGLGQGRFGAPVGVPLTCLQYEAAAPNATATTRDVELIYFGDIDGDGRAEVATLAGFPDEGKSDRQSAFDGRLRLHHMQPDGSLDPAPYTTSDIRGIPLTVSYQGLLLRALTDLDGDRRKELLTVTFDVSTIGALAAVMTKRLSVGLEFHVYYQDQQGRFVAIEGQSLKETLKLNFKRLRLDRFAQFAGDFDGDGRSDFVHLSTGRSITIHPGKPDGRYDDDPAFALALEQAIDELGDISIRDLDGDQRADIALTRRRGTDDPVASTPVWLDLFMSGGAR